MSKQFALIIYNNDPISKFSFIVFDKEQEALSCFERKVKEFLVSLIHKKLEDIHVPKSVMEDRKCWFCTNTRQCLYTVMILKKIENNSFDLDLNQEIFIDEFQDTDTSLDRLHLLEEL